MLVIIGLIVGGVLMGRDLIRASELQSIASDYQKYKTVIQTFRVKYNALPGDFSEATVFWPASGSCGHQTVQPSGQTCNGNGDYKLNAGAEGYRFWQHLALAGLIQGEYAGASGPDQVYWHVVPGWNTPVSKVDNAAWNALSVYYDNAAFGYSAIGGDIAAGTFAYGINQIHLATVTGTTYNNGSIMTPQEQWQLDLKIDDGKPGTGKMRANDYRTCTDAADQFAAATSTPVYDMSRTDKVCAITFLLDGINYN